MRQNLLTKFYLRQFILPQVFILSRTFKGALGNISLCSPSLLMRPPSFQWGGFQPPPQRIAKKVGLKERLENEIQDIKTK